MWKADSDVVVEQLEEGFMYGDSNEVLRPAKAMQTKKMVWLKDNGLKELILANEQEMWSGA